MNALNALGRVRTRHVLLAALGLVLLIVIGEALWSFRRFDALLNELNVAAQRQQRAEDAIARFSRIALDLETGVRGYALTGSPEFLEPYLRAERARPEATEQLGSSLEGEAGTSARRAAAELGDWQQRIGSQLAAEGRGGTSEQQLALQVEGKQRMDHVRALLAQTRERLAESRHARRQAVVEFQRRFEQNAWLMAGAIGLLLVLIAFGLVSTVERPLARLVAEVEHLGKPENTDLVPALSAQGAYEVRELTRSLQQLLTASHANRRREQRFTELMSTLSAGGDVSNLADVALRTLVSETGAVGGALFAAGNDEPLRCLATVGISPSEAEKHAELSAKVRQSGQAVYIDELPRHTHYVLRSALLDSVPRALLVAPLPAGPRVIGAVELVGDLDVAKQSAEFERALPRIGLALHNALAGRRLAELQAEMAEMNVELQAQNEELRAQEEALRLQGDELRKQQLELSDRNRELAQSSRHKTDFLSNASHELRTPLNAILGFSELLLRGSLGVLGNRQRNALEDVSRAGRHLLALVNDLLDLSKIEAGRVEVEARPIDLATCADSALALVAGAAERSGVSLNNLIAAGEFVVVADARRLHQVISNLLANAIRFTPEHGRVTLRAAKLGGHVRVEVEDTGAGIAEIERARLFQPFEQFAASERDTGTGLGLAISKRLVELMGGEIGCRSEVNVGSTFFFTLPRAHQGVGPAVPEPRDSDSPRAAGPEVLLVEDRESDARWTASILVEHGFRVRVAGTAERALEALEEAAPDALIVDLGLPDMSGAALMERVRKTFPKQRLPIVVLTALELKQQEIAELETLADLVVEKGMMPGTAFAEALSGLCTGVRARPKVLVIDDSDLNRKVMDALLGSAGYTVELATDAESGLILALAEPPALVLMDSRLPGMSGLEATRRLKANPRTQHVPVIVVSAQAMTGDRERALDAGCAAYVTKPVARRDLFEAIDRVMLPAKKPG